MTGAHGHFFTKRFSPPGPERALLVTTRDARGEIGGKLAAPRAAAACAFSRSQRLGRASAAHEISVEKARALLGGVTLDISLEGLRAGAATG